MYIKAEMRDLIGMRLPEEPDKLKKGCWKTSNFAEKSDRMLADVHLSALREKYPSFTFKRHRAALFLLAQHQKICRTLLAVWPCV